MYACDRPFARRLDQIVGLIRRAREAAGETPQPREQRNEFGLEGWIHGAGRHANQRSARRERLRPRCIPARAKNLSPLAWKAIIWSTVR
jgi:hypothetical protein